MSTDPLNRYNGFHATANLLGQSIPLWLEYGPEWSNVSAACKIIADR